MFINYSSHKFANWLVFHVKLFLGVVCKPCYSSGFQSIVRCSRCVFEKVKKSTNKIADSWQVVANVAKVVANVAKVAKPETWEKQVVF